MVKTFESVLMEHGGHETSVLANFLLNTVEEYGMLPPSRRNPLAEHLSYREQRERSVPYYVNIWERENETK